MKFKEKNLFFQFKNIIDVVPGDVYWKNIDGIWIGLNKHCLESLYKMKFIKNIDENLVIGKTDYEIFGKETAKKYRENDLYVMKNNIKITYEEETKLPTGETIFLLSTKSPLINEKQDIIGTIGNTIDITDRKKIELELEISKNNAEAASRVKSEFLENMRHDIRTPLTGIIGFSEFIKSKASNPIIKEYADSLVESSHALLDFMDEILEAIRVSSGEIPKSKNKFSLKEISNHVINLYKSAAANKNLNYFLEFDENIPKYVLGDNIRLHRVILELVNNALTFTNQGFVKLKVDLAKCSNSMVIVKFIVEDSGIGIPVSKQRDVFLQFKRLSPAYEGIYKGAGLGLYIIKQFIEDLKGEIYLESTPNVGSRFICIIPFQEPLLDDEIGVDNAFLSLKNINTKSYKQHFYNHSNSISENKTSNFGQNQNNKNIKILVVEDNHIAQTVAKIMLEKYLSNIDIAGSAYEAINLCKNNKYTLIFMDIGLPDMKGYEATKIIRKLKLNIDTPIVALSAHLSENEKNICISAGMDAVLIKPLTQINCEETLASYIFSKTTDNFIDHENKLKLELSKISIINFANGLEVNVREDNYYNILKILVQEFLPKENKILRQACDANDVNNLKKIIYDIKDGALHTGANRLQKICEYFEDYLQAGKDVSTEIIFEEISKVINETINYIKTQFRDI